MIVRQGLNRLEDKLLVMEQICEGLAYAHEQGRHPPRPQARQHPRPAEPRGQDPRLRPRPPGRVGDDAHGHGDGHAQLHVAGAGARREGGRALRPLLGGSRLLRAALRPQALRFGVGALHPLRGPGARPAALAELGAGPPAPPPAHRRPRPRQGSGEALFRRRPDARRGACGAAGDRGGEGGGGAAPARPRLRGHDRGTRLPDDRRARFLGGLPHLHRGSHGGGSHRPRPLVDEHRSEPAAHGPPRAHAATPRGPPGAGCSWVSCLSPSSSAWGSSSGSACGRPRRPPVPASSWRRSRRGFSASSSWRARWSSRAPTSTTRTTRRRPRRRSAA